MFASLNRLARALAVVSAFGILYITTPTFAERAGGAGLDRGRVPALGSVTYRNEWFEADKPALVGIRGDGDTALGLFVYDEDGNLIASDTTPGDPYVVRFTPKRTARFRIVVINFGSVYNDYMIMTN